MNHSLAHEGSPVWIVTCVDSTFLLIVADPSTQTEKVSWIDMRNIPLEGFRYAMSMVTASPLLLDSPSEVDKSIPVVSDSPT